MGRGPPGSEDRGGVEVVSPTHSASGSLLGFGVSSPTFRTPFGRVAPRGIGRRKEGKKKRGQRGGALQGRIRGECA